MITYTYKFILRKDHRLADGTYGVVLQAFIGGTRVRIKMDFHLQESEWDEVRQCARIQKDKERERRINAILTKFKGRIEDLFFEARMSGTALTATAFTEELDNKPILESLVGFIEKEIQNERADREKSTVKQYGTLLKHLKDFRPAAAFGDVSFEFVQDFDRWLKKKSIGDNARAKYHTMLRKFILLAIRKRRKIRNPYLDFKIRSVEVDPTWLSVEEVDDLVRLYQSRTLGKQLQRAIRQFLFQVFTSLRVSDIHQVSKADVQGDMLVLMPQKTKRLRKLVKIPLSDFALQLIADGDGKGDLIFNTLPDPTANKYLKEIAAIAKIKKRITTHVGRHTFGFLYLVMGGKVEELQEIMGHSDLKTTQVYTHTDYDRKVAGIRKFDDKFRIAI